MIRKIFKFTEKKIISKQKYHKFLMINRVSKNILNKTEISIYFSGGMGQVYQIDQWINTFQKLNEKHKLVIIVRSFSVYLYWRKKLPFNILYFYYLKDFMDFYEVNNPKCIIYINNGFKNFQSLIYQKAMHIHINHGESDKSSDHSNQVKAYDYIFVHGPNGYNNYIKYLIKLDNDQLVQTGRPQLDFIKPINLDTKGKKVVIYAPTWEATHKSMRYTSIDIYGQQIVDTILDSDQYFFIYKPHPNIGANDNNVKKINNYIINRTKESEFALTITNEDVNNIYPLVDFAIFDMSSIMTDYLNVDKPFILADVFDPEVHNVSEYNVLKACNRLTNDNIDNLLEVIETEILNDPLKEKRAEIKELYLGNYKKGESIKKFLDSVSKIIEQRDREVKRLKEYR